MIVDTDGSSCVNVNFGIGGGTTNTQRQWDIMVSIYLIDLNEIVPKVFE